MSEESDESNDFDLCEHGDVKYTCQSVKQNKYESNNIEFINNNKRKLELISVQDQDDCYYE